MLISKFITSQPEKQTIAMPILLNISICKDNQTIKFGQLAEYNMKYTIIHECGGETIPRSFSEKSKSSISLDQQAKVSYSLFLLYVKLKAIEIY